MQLVVNDRLVKRQARFGYQDSSDYFRAYRDYYASVA